MLLEASRAPAHISSSPWRQGEAAEEEAGECTGSGVKESWVHHSSARYKLCHLG